MAYTIGTGSSGEIDVADAWKTYSIVGAVLWGVTILARVFFVVAGCAMLAGPEGAIAGATIGIGACCCTFIAFLGLVGFTIWGSTLRFGEVGMVASEEILRDSGMAFLIGNIIHYVIVVLPLALCMCCTCCILCVAGTAAAAGG